MRKPRSFTIQLEIVGMQWRTKIEFREMLKREVPFPVELEREPDNKGDENAIKVILAADHKLTKLRGMHIGYLRRGTAELFAPKLDAGTIEPVKLWVLAVEPKAGTATMDCRFRDKRVKSGSTKRKTTK